MSEITTTKAASGNLLITIILDKDQLDPLFGFSGDKRLLCLFYVHAYGFQHQANLKRSCYENTIFVLRQMYF